MEKYIARSRVSDNQLNTVREGRWNHDRIEIEITIRVTTRIERPDFHLK